MLRQQEVELRSCFLPRRAEATPSTVLRHSLHQSTKPIRSLQARSNAGDAITGVVDAVAALLALSRPEPIVKTVVVRL